MRKLNVLSALCFVAMMAVGAVSASAAEPIRGGDHLPTPFKLLNTKVELADGESYVLEGTVAVGTFSAYLEVDLETHPWLATKKRKAFPFYALEGGLSFWRKYAGVRVRVQGQAVAQDDGTIGVRLLSKEKKHLKTLDNAGLWQDNE